MIDDFIRNAMRAGEIDKVRAITNLDQEQYDALVRDAMLWRSKGERIITLENALRPFCSGSEWGKWKAWLVNGAPDREQGIEAAKKIVRLNMMADSAIANSSA